MTPRNKPHFLQDHLFLIGAINRRYNVPHAVWRLVFFALYYLVPLVLCAFEGVLITGNAAQQKLLPPQITWLAKHVGDHPAVTLPYLRDSRHLLMAVVVSIGGGVALAASMGSIKRS